MEEPLKSPTYKESSLFLSDVNCQYANINLATAKVIAGITNGKQLFKHGLVCFRCNMKCLLMDKGVARKIT